ncbi:iron chaperone [Kaistella faecalis]|uniref:iron chaperone n=1 Tax=Kaistella faecalis TaxID=2852098 RepID=UPI001C4722BB|nr:DUF1801 domain-containing protein [Chryseobacterium faecale]UFK97635.1 DUF1801 domain-containing protein [Chryseobacterium faecale]
METADIYIKQFPANVQEILARIRTIIFEEAPEAEEKISYAMPGYFLNIKPLVYIAGYKNHIGLYATPTGHEEFKKELSECKQGKGSVQFPLNSEIPYELIRRIIKFRKQEIEK